MDRNRKRKAVSQPNATNGGTSNVDEMYAKVQKNVPLQHVRSSWNANAGNLNFSRQNQILKYPSTLWKLQKFTLIEKKFRQINYSFSKFFSRNVTFTKFLPKMSEKKFP